MDSIIYDLINMKQILEFDKEYNFLVEQIEDIIYQLKNEIEVIN